MAKITFLGASGTVTGSSFLLTSKRGNRVLIDMGMFQGVDETTQLNFAELPYDPRRLFGVILTHAHLDHCGRLPLLTMNGYTGKIHMTRATKNLFELTLLDAAKVGREGHRSHPILYVEEDVEKLKWHAEEVRYHSKIAISEYEIEFYDAGHILGSASLVVKVDGKTIAFSGDLGNTPEDLLKPTEYINEADIVVMESTYGDRTHSNEDPEVVLQEEISAIEESGGTLLIPAFSVERSQEILHLIDHLKKEKKIKDETHVYLDSPMAIKVTNIYRQYKDLYSQELAIHSQKDDPFDFPGLTFVEKGKESQNILNDTGPKVIIAGSGMMHGGRIVNHAINYLPLSNTRLLIVGFQAKGTLGRALLEGAKEVQIYDKIVKVNCHIRKSSGMSAHADQPKLINWFSKIKGVEKLYLIHGEDEPRKVLKEKIKEVTGFDNTILPTLHYSEDL